MIIFNYEGLNLIQFSVSYDEKSKTINLSKEIIPDFYSN